MKIGVWLILCAAVIISLTAGCNTAKRSSYTRHPAYSSKYSRQARQYAKLKEKAREEEEKSRKKEEQEQKAREKRAEKERKKLEKRLAAERKAREKAIREEADKVSKETDRRRSTTRDSLWKKSTVEKRPEKTEKKERSRWFPSKSEENEPVKARSVPDSSIIDAGSPSTPYRLKPGDMIAIFLRGIPREEQIEDIIDENGYITLSYINLLRAGGKTTSQLEQSIRKAYLDAQIYKDISVNVVVQAQSYFVRGEIRNPGRFALMSGVTLLQAIAASGGYTEYAQPKKVKLIRNNKSTIIDVKRIEKYPEKDVVIEAGDNIVVPRSAF